MFSFDLSIISSFLCLVPHFNFYLSLISSTSMLLLTVLAIRMYSLCGGGRRLTPRSSQRVLTSGTTEAAEDARAHHKRLCLLVAVYLLAFSYPIIAVRVVDTFKCQLVVYDSTHSEFYLSADYSLKCYDATWYTMAAYATVWVVMYVAAFPLFTIYTLYGYREQLHNRAMPADLTFGFLLSDYRLHLPCYLW
jgi:hypothetical protein